MKCILPEEGSVCPLLRSDWRGRVEQRKDMGMFDSVVCNANLHFPLGADLVWEGGAAPYSLSLSGAGEKRSVSQLYTTSYRAVNLYSGEKYFWEVTDACGQKVSSSFSTAPGVRMIAFPLSAGGPLNFRDLGGRQTIYGRRVRQGMIYRGAQLEWYHFFRENKEYILNTLHIRTDLDLRYDCQVTDEMALGGVSFLGKSVKWLHYTVNAYDAFTPEQCELFRKTLQTFAYKENYPIYFHCFGGADRTGEISFLLNGLAGVAPEELFDDYELSALSIFPRSRSLEYFQRWLKKIASYSSETLPLHEQIEKYFLAIGLTPEEISAIKENMLE